MRRRTLLLAALVLAGAADQAVQHTLLADGMFLGRFIAPFDPPLFTDAQRAYVTAVERALAGDAELSELSRFDRELGWCPRPLTTAFDANFDELGARRSALPHARVAAPNHRRIVTIGGSFTMAMEVGDLEAWPARVEARAERTEVVNLGVAGFGLDQAYLRFRRDGADLAPDEVWIGFMPEASLRVSTHYAPAYHRWASMCAFKPRFLPDDEASDGLRLVANPAADLAGALELLTDQAAFFDALGASDLWVRRAPAAFRPRGDSLLHHSAAARLALTLFEARGRDRAAWLAEPESEVHRVLSRLTHALAGRLEETGARLRVAVLPSRPDLAQRARDGRGYWEDFIARLVARGIDVVDTSEALAALGGAANDALWRPRGHYSAAGNEAVADVLREAWLP